MSARHLCGHAASRISTACCAWRATAKAIDIGCLQVRPFTVPHDAREPLQLTCTDGDTSWASSPTWATPRRTSCSNWPACGTVLLECNHDTEMLAQSSYPPFLKRRVGGALRVFTGHLAKTTGLRWSRS
jgi:hypothetical protein